MKYLLMLTLLFPVTLVAGELYLDVNGYSKHSKDTYRYQGKQHEYNNKNVGLGVTYDFSKYVEVLAGFYDNSYNKNTLYGGAKLKYDFVFGDVVVTPGINVGVFTGYEDTHVQADRYQIVATPAVRITYRGVGATIGYLPAIEKNEPGVVPISTVVVQINIRVW